LKRFSALLVVTSSFVIGGILLSSCAVIFERNLWPRSLSVDVIIAVILLSFMYCLGLLSWYDVLQRTHVFQLYALLFAMPVLAVVISVIVLHETFSAADVIFSALTLLGVAVVQGGRNDA
jgi:drug/metabolite transporter (DMT)-like permease